VDTEFTHTGLEGGALDAKDGGGAARAGDAPTGLSEDVEDVLALSIVEGAEGSERRRGGRRGLERAREVKRSGGEGGGAGEFLEFGDGNAKFFSRGEEDGAFDEIF